MNPSANFLMELLLAASLIGNLVFLGIRIFGREKRTIEPQPFKVQAQEKFVTDTDCARIHGEANRRLTAVEHQLSEDRAAAVEGRRKLHDELRAIRQEMHAMELRVDEKQEARIEKVHTRINDVLQAVATLDGKIND